MNMRRIIVHIDINQFFAAATILLEPELKGKPLVIGSDDRRGIVSTASYEARKYGIHSAMPTYQAKKLCKNLIIRPTNFKWYQKKSNDFFDFLKNNYTSQIEIVSVDECYLDFTDLMKDVKDPLKYLTQVQKDIYDHTSLDVSIGLGPTKFLAKMGSDYKKPRGITIIRKRDIKKILYPLDIADFYGIGKKTVPKLKNIGINTIGDFALNDSYELKKIMGSFYLNAKELIKGNGNDIVDPSPFDPKSISSEITFLYDTNNYEEITSMLMIKSKEVALQAQNDEKLGKTIRLIIKDADFKTINRSITIEKPVNDYMTIYSYVLRLFDKYFNNQLIRLVGVGLSSLIDKKDYFVQISLFEQEKHQQECKTSLLINKLNRKVNKKVFIKASEIKGEQE